MDWLTRTTFQKKKPEYNIFQILTHTKQRSSLQFYQDILESLPFKSEYQLFKIISLRKNGLPYERVQLVDFGKIFYQLKNWMPTTLSHKHIKKSSMVDGFWESLLSVEKMNACDIVTQNILKNQAWMCKLWTTNIFYKSKEYHRFC